MRMGMPSANLPKPSAALPETRLLPPEKVSVLDGLMDIRLSKYPTQDGGGFYRIDIIPKKDAKLLPFAKDSVFCIDASGSISQVKLNEFKQGVKNSLPELKPDDGFEIISFRHKNYPLFGSCVAPAADNMAAADKYLFQLSRGGSTDIYGALKPFAGASSPYKRQGRPLLLFLASDGRVNSGEVIDSRELINTFSNQNHDSVSIFCFSTGRGANTFLLDLLAYRNRGVSISSPILDKSRFVLDKFIDEVSDICVMSLDYQVSSDIASFTFPKKLPHLYARHALSIYGKYPPGTDELGLRITGLDSRNDKQELVYAADLRKAETGGRDIMQDWAMQYIYHLYSSLTASFEEGIRNEIHRTAAEYGLQLPYLDYYLIDKNHYSRKTKGDL
jgi:hypothetical protein